MIREAWLLRMNSQNDCCTMSNEAGVRGNAQRLGRTLGGRWRRRRRDGGGIAGRPVQQMRRPRGGGGGRTCLIQGLA